MVEKKFIKGLIKIDYIIYESPVSAVVVPIINAELTARTCFFFIVCSLLIFHKFFA
ncbi:hypothetical protein F230042K4_16600 [Mediterraneibacter glycyrrhizinilyticus]